MKENPGKQKKMPKGRPEIKIVVSVLQGWQSYRQKLISATRNRDKIQLTNIWKKGAKDLIKFDGVFDWIIYHWNNIQD